MLSNKAKKIVRKQLRNYFGTSNLDVIRKHLKSNAKNEYGCYHVRLDIGGGISIGYTSNENHFAKFYFTLQGVGYSNTLALTKKDLTKAGINRGCATYYAM